MLIPYSILPIGVAAVIAVVLSFTLLRSRKVFRLGKHLYGIRNFTRRSFGVLLLAVFAMRLFRDDAVYGQVGLEGGPLPAPTMLIVTLVRWFGLLTVSMALLSPFFKKRALHDYMAFIAPFSVVLSCLYLEESFLTITGNPDPLYWRNVFFIIEQGLIMTIAFCELIRFFRRRLFADLGKRTLRLMGFILTYVIAFMPSWAPAVLFDRVGKDPTGFTLEHRLLLYFSIFFMFFFYVTLRNRPYDERRFATIALAASAFFNYFSVARIGISGLPLHLCNTAIMLMLITYVFRLHGLFYFTYLVNVLGALFAIILPNTSGALSEPGNVIFWFNHIYAFALPILGVALGIFPRPNFKMITKAIGVFSIYFVFAATLDGWLNNAPFNTTVVDGVTETITEVDYFFLYSTFYVDKFKFVLPLYKPWDVTIGDQLIRYFPMYQLTIYVIFIASMFALWGIYATLFRVSDDHKELAKRRNLLREDHLRLIAELGDRPLSEPLNPEGTDMIKIEHFTKIYNGSTRKSADDINIEIHSGEVFGFIGHNGAGKSTTIKSLVGIQSITEGRIEIEGYDISRQPMEAKMHIGYVSDNHAVYEKLTGREYVNYVADLYRVPKADREARLAKYTKMFHLEEAIDREIKGYSHGMKQKIMVISALIHNPKVWVLDEPLTGLDPTSSYQIKQCMREHANEGNIVFFSSHIIEVVERICDRIAIISGGKICQCSTMDEIRASGRSLEEIYLQYIDGPEGALLAAERAEDERRRLAEAAARAEAEAAVAAAEDAEEGRLPAKPRRRRKNGTEGTEK